MLEDEDQGRWHRPLVRLTDVVPAELANELHRHKIMVAVNGELLRVQASGLVTWHICPDRIPQAQPVRPREIEDVEPLDDRSERDREASRPRWRKPIPGSPSKKELKSNYEDVGAAVLEVECPGCGVEPGAYCRHKSASQHHRRLVVRPHKERCVYAVDTGLVLRGFHYDLIRPRSVTSTAFLEKSYHEREQITIWLRENYHPLFDPLESDDIHRTTDPTDPTDPTEAD